MGRLFILLPAIVLFCACSLSETEEIVSSDPSRYTFVSADGGDDLVIRAEKYDGKDGIYEQPPFIIGIYSCDCEYCKKQVPYFDKLAQQYRGVNNAEFIILFAKDDIDSIKKAGWTQDIKSPRYYKGKEFVNGMGISEVPYISVIINGKESVAFSGWTDSKEELLFKEISEEIGKLIK